MALSGCFPVYSICLDLHPLLTSNHSCSLWLAILFYPPFLCFLFLSLPFVPVRISKAFEHGTLVWPSCQFFANYKLPSLLLICDCFRGLWESWHCCPDEWWPDSVETLTSIAVEQPTCVRLPHLSLATYGTQKQ